MIPDGKTIKLDVAVFDDKILIAPHEKKDMSVFDSVDDLMYHVGLFSEDGNIHIFKHAIIEVDL